MNIIKLLKIARKIPGVSIPDTVTYFADLFKNEIIKLSQQKLINQNNKVAILAGVNNAGDLIFCPIEIEHKPGVKPTIVQEFVPHNIHQTIRETDIDKALDMFSKKDQPLSFFEVLDQCKKQPGS